MRIVGMIPMAWSQPERFWNFLKLEFKNNNLIPYQLREKNRNNVKGTQISLKIKEGKRDSLTIQSTVKLDHQVPDFEKKSLTTQFNDMTHKPRQRRNGDERVDIDIYNIFNGSGHKYREYLR